MNLFWQHNRGRIVGVTGTNGKSTTTALIYAMLRDGGLKCRIGGNIGVSLLPEVEEIAPEEWVVLELSSFQLADLDALQRGPQVAVVTNFAPNHLDRHASLEEYRSAKQTILRWQRAGDTAVLNADDPDVAAWHVRGTRLYFGGEDPSDAVQNALSVTRYGVRGMLAGRRFEIDLTNQLHLRGRHNRLNVAAAALAAAACGVSPEAIPAAVRGFRGLPHRLQFLGEFAGRRFYNDSKATTPEAALAALAAFDEGERLIVLIGGSAKGVDLSRLAAGVAHRAKAAVLLGETASELSAAIHAAGNSVRCHVPVDFPEAVAWAVEQSAGGDTILLSPGCASYDWFASYEDRGDQFTALVRRQTASLL